MRVWFVVLTLVATGACAANGAGPSSEKRRGGEAVPVAATKAVQKPMPIDLRVVGTVEPCATVGVRPQVGGQLTEVHFAEGQEVKKDDVLFTIDPRPFAAQLHQAEANLAKDTAQAQNAAAQLARYRDLVGRGIATREQLDQITTTESALQATLKADAAAVENAKLQLDYTTIRAPISGRTGALIVHAGNVVRTTDTSALVVINQLSPIYVTFPVPEASLADIRRYQAAGSLRVGVEVPGNDGTERGAISFVDNAVDRSTGTIKVKGVFQNADRRLWPGLFVNVVLTLKTEPNAVVIPSRAIQEAQEGKYVYVVKANGTVESRPVTLARTAGDVAVVSSGISAGETVVTDGQLRLVPGARVAINREPATTAAGQR